MNIRKLSIPSLLDFVAIANCGSINKAAHELKIYQSSLTRSVRQLESNLGVELFVRTPGGIRLTEYGGFVLEHDRVIKAELRQATLDPKLLSGESAASVSIGMSPTVALSIGLRAVLQMMHGSKKVEVRIVAAIKQLLLSELLMGRIGICVAMSNPEERFPDLNIE